VQPETKLKKSSLAFLQDGGELGEGAALKIYLPVL
jgi:hypothetical protein